MQSSLQQDENTNPPPILSLDEVEAELLTLSEIAAVTMQCFASVDADTVDAQAKQHITRFHQVLSNIRRSLMFHIQNAPRERRCNQTDHIDRLRQSFRNKVKQKSAMTVNSDEPMKDS